MRVAAAAGARTIVLTNAAGAVSETLRGGDVVLVTDHLNLTGTSPIDDRDDARFVVMADAYAPELRRIVRERATDAGDLRDGIYAGVRGPQFETAAEVRALRIIGADVVGMSTVLETIAARALGMDVLAISLVTNVAGTAQDASHTDVLAASRLGAGRVARAIEAFLGARTTGERSAVPPPPG